MSDEVMAVLMWLFAFLVGSVLLVINVTVYLGVGYLLWLLLHQGW